MPDSQTSMVNAVAQIVVAYVASTNVAVEDLPALIICVSRAMEDSRNPIHNPALRTRQMVASDPTQEGDDDKLTCLICGKRATMLRPHIKRTHGIDPVVYLIRFHLPLDHPLTAPSHSRLVAERFRKRPQSAPEDDLASE